LVRHDRFGDLPFVHVFEELAVRNLDDLCLLNGANDIQQRERRCQ
jgi:hypothetical protein